MRKYGAHLARIRAKGAEIIARARRRGRQIVVLAGRPYHIDNEINHGINKLITGYGAAVISEDCISHLTPKQHTNILNQWTYHARLFSAARYICDKPDMQLVQLVSFGCGLDAVTTDEVREILHRSGKLWHADQDRRDRRPWRGQYPLAQHVRRARAEPARRTA